MIANGEPTPDPAFAAIPRRTFARRAEDLVAPATQIVTDRDAYLGNNGSDIGRRIADDHVELFVDTDVASALQQEFIRIGPEFIAVHDVGASASLRLLGSLAGAAKAKIQRLSVRREGHGVALAALQFVEVPLADGSPIRVYATDLNAGAGVRAEVARVLLAHARLGVMLVGELPGHALASRLQPLQQAVQKGPWPNRDLLMVPLGSGSALAGQAALLGAGNSVAVHVAPHANKPSQVWSFIGGAWNRLHGVVQAGGRGALPTDLAQAVAPPVMAPNMAPTEAMGLDPLGPLPTAPRRGIAEQRPMPRAGATGWQAYAERCAAIKGSVACCVFDVHAASTLAIAPAGAPPSAGRLAQQGSQLMTVMQEAARSLGLGNTPVEASLSTGSHHLLLRPVPGHPGVAVHLLLLASTGNLTLARLQLERVDAPT